MSGLPRLPRRTALSARAGRKRPARASTVSPRTGPGYFPAPFQVRFGRVLEFFDVKYAILDGK